ncbi:L,D-transpeptidase family protein [bacterium]|nr:L,D-transpeptidase family protein [bacterium]
MRYKVIFVPFLLVVIALCGYANLNAEGTESSSFLEPSPQWVVNLSEAKEARQLFIVAAYAESTAWISMHEKDEAGGWNMIMSTPGFIGRDGLGKTKEGDHKTPVGVYSFNRAFGIADFFDCAIPYVKVDSDSYWSGDNREGRHYNELVSLKDYPDLDIKNSEHIIDYSLEYQHCLNISYNKDGIPGLGSAIFLHCLGPRKPFTGGCVAIPQDQMKRVLENVLPDCVVVIDSLGNLGGSF